MSRIQKDLEKIDKIKKDLCEYLIAEVKKIEQNPDIKPMNKNGFTVSSSTIFSTPGIILSPFYYDFELQKNLVIEHISKAKDAGVSYINSVIETGKDKTTGKPYNPVFIENLKVIISK